MKRIVFVMNIPSPYRLHMFKEIDRQLVGTGYQLHVAFMSKGHKDRPKEWIDPSMSFSHSYWRDFGFGQCHFNPGLVWSLIRCPPVWLHIGSPFDTLTCILISFLNKASILCAGCEGNTKTPGQLHGFKGWLKRAVYSRCQYITIPGQEGVRFVALHQSLTRKQMPTPILLPNVVDESRFLTRDKLSKDVLARTRSVMGAREDEKLCLIPARFVWEKGLVPFFRLLTPDMIRRWHLTIMGHGPLQSEVERVLDERGLRPFVTILHSVAYDEMPQHYASADLMLLPSVYDQNPLTVVEAVHSGLPIALSEMAGNVDEGVTEGVNGWVLPVKDPERFKAKLSEVFSTSMEELRRRGNQSLSSNAKFWRIKDVVGRYLREVVACIERKER